MFITVQNSHWQKTIQFQCHWYLCGQKQTWFMPTICNPLSSHRCTKFSDRHHHCLYKKSAPAPLYGTNGECILQTCRQVHKVNNAMIMLWKLFLDFRKCYCRRGWLVRVLSRIYCLGRSPKCSNRMSFLGGSGGMLPGNVLKWICVEMPSGAFWDTILRNVKECALTL